VYRPHGVERGGSRLKNILLVEGDPSRAELLVRAMQPAGFAVTPIAEGERALVKAKGAKPDLILLASVLPDMSGFSLCNRLRRTPGLADVPILLIPADSDAAATESHRAGKTPADGYLPSDASPEQVAQRVSGLLRAATESGRTSLPPPLPGSSDGAPPVLQLTREVREGTAPGDSAMAAPAMPPPLPGAAPPPLRPVKIVDPFEDLPAEPRLPLGASPDDKVAFFRERLKAKDELLGKVRQSFQMLKDDVVARDREGAALRKGLEELRAVRTEREAQLAATQRESARLAEALDEAQSQVTQKTHESRQTQQEAEERAQSLSELLNATLQEREQSEKQWGAKLAEAERKVALLQEEVDHLAAESEGSQMREKAQMEALSQLQDALQAARGDSQREGAAVAELLAQREQERDAVVAELEATRREVAAKGEEIQAEQARAAAVATDLEDLAQQFASLSREKESAQEETTSRLADLSAQLAELQSHNEELAGRVAESEAKQAELRGELEALQQGSVEAHDQLGAAEGRHAELEAELQSRTEEAGGLRSALETVRADWEAMQDDLAGQIANLTAEVQGKDRELLAKDRELLAKQKEMVSKERELAATLERRQQEMQATLEAKDHEMQSALESRDRDMHGALESKDQELQAVLESKEQELQAALEAKEREAQDALEARDRELNAELENKERELQGALEREAAAKAVPPPAPEGRSASEQALRVRLSDLTAELQAMRKRFQQVQQGQPNAAAQKAADALREELEAQRAENEFLSAELERTSEKLQELQDRAEVTIKD
jgi:CheY-like chemotaxis protein